MVQTAKTLVIARATAGLGPAFQQAFHKNCGELDRSIEGHCPNAHSYEASMNRKVTVVGGAGNVGMTVARAIAEKELADVVIIDIAEQKAAGVALDIYETCPIIGSDSRLIGGSDWGAGRRLRHRRDHRRASRASLA
jgi:hypothetical protein